MARRGENIYRRKDGRYEGRYVIGKTAKGKTRFGYVYARQFSEVRRLLLEKKAEQQRKTGRPAGARRITVAKWMRTWMESELLGSVKPSSYQVYLRQFERHVLPALGGYALSELTPGIIHGFVVRLESSDLARSTAKGIYRLLAAAMRSAQEEGLILKNPCRKIRVQREERAAQRALSRQEQETLCAQPEEQADLPALLSLYTGMRLGGDLRAEVDGRGLGAADHRGAAHGAAGGAAGSGGREADDADGRVDEIPAVGARASGARVPAGAAEGATHRNRLGVHIWGFQPRGGAAHAPAAVQAPDGAAGDRGGALPHAAAQLCHAAAGAGDRRQDGERTAGAPLSKDDAGLLRPRPDRPAALRHGAARRLSGRRLSRQAP